MLKRENIIHPIQNNNDKNYSDIKIQEISFIKKINLRLNPNNKNFMAICGKILGTILPTKPNTYNKIDKIKIVWLGPDEWLIIYNDENNILEKLQHELGNLETSVTDISENRTIINVSGDKVNILLSKFLVLDLEKNLSNESSCAQTLFVKVPILLLRNNKKNQIQDIDILTNRSHANYIYKLLLDGTINLDI
tara:strand:- start:1978 stop:2556 length:579 start_codon:yes stop_codon:yes gene_type:complete